MEEGGWGDDPYGLNRVYITSEEGGISFTFSNRIDEEILDQYYEDLERSLSPWAISWADDIVTSEQLSEEEYEGLIDAFRNSAMFYGQSYAPWSHSGAEEVNKLDPNSAYQRSRKLFLDSLTKEQEVSFQSEKRIGVTGSNGGRYIIDCSKGSYMQNISEYEDPDTVYCITLSSDIPLYDHYLAQKLLIENDESRFLRMANQFKRTGLHTYYLRQVYWGKVE